MKYDNRLANKVIEKEEFEQLWEKFLNELDNAGMDKVLEYLNRK